MLELKFQRVDLIRPTNNVEYLGCIWYGERILFEAPKGKNSINHPFFFVGY